MKLLTNELLNISHIEYIGISVKGLENVLPEVPNKAVMLMDKTPGKGAEGFDIAFLHPKSSKGVLIELCEDKNI